MVAVINACAHARAPTLALHAVRCASTVEVKQCFEVRGKKAEKVHAK